MIKTINKRENAINEKICFCYFDNLFRYLYTRKFKFFIHIKLIFQKILANEKVK